MSQGTSGLTVYIYSKFEVSSPVPLQIYVNIQYCHICYWEKIQHLWGAAYIIISCITFWNCRLRFSILLYVDSWPNTLLCCSPSYSSFQSPFSLFQMASCFILSSLPQKPCGFPALTGPQLCIFPVCKLLQKSGEDKLFVPYANCDNPCQVTIVAVINLHLNFTIYRSISQTNYYCFVYANWKLF
jgi:hypothetical protein